MGKYLSSEKLIKEYSQGENGPRPLIDKEVILKVSRERSPKKKQNNNSNKKKKTNGIISHVSNT
jgi:hypothetical protein